MLKLVPPMSDLTLDHHTSVAVARRLHTWQEIGVSVVLQSRTTAAPTPLADYHRRCDAWIIHWAWLDHDCNITATARKLKVSRRTVRKGLAAYEASRPPENGADQ